MKFVVESQTNLETYDIVGSWPELPVVFLKFTLVSIFISTICSLELELERSGFRGSSLPAPASLSCSDLAQSTVSM